MKFIYTFIKIFYYFFIGIICLSIILLYIGDLSLNPLYYNVTLFSSYCFLTTLLLPFFRFFNKGMFRSGNNKIVTYKEKALSMHQKDKNNNSKNERWSVNGVSFNPWQYTTNNTATYGNTAGWGYNIFISLILSALFILFAPFFGIILFFKNTSKYKKD